MAIIRLGKRADEEVAKQVGSVRNVKGGKSTKTLGRSCENRLDGRFVGLRRGALVSSFQAMFDVSDRNTIARADQVFYAAEEGGNRNHVQDGAPSENTTHQGGDV